MLRVRPLLAFRSLKITNPRLNQVLKLSDYVCGDLELYSIYQKKIFQVRPYQTSIELEDYNFCLTQDHIIL